MNDIATLLNRDDTTIAVVGATDDPHKYGSVIYRDLKRKGYEVFAVNPNRDTVDGDPAYSSLGAESPEVMTFLTEHDFNYLANACIMVRSRLRAGP